MIRKLHLTMTVACLAFSPPALAEPNAVVELFTSQGCSSCRSADALLVDLVKRDGVLVLSYHVDYWDFLGWADTLAVPENAARQRAYSDVMGSRRIFTPQLLVNGVAGPAGGEWKEVEASLERASLSVPVALRRENGAVSIEVGAKPVPGWPPMTIRLVAFTSVATVPITRGENAGATIRYINVARGGRSIGMWDGAPVRIDLPEKEVMSNGADGCAVLVQEELGKGPGAIVGAAIIGGAKP